MIRHSILSVCAVLAVSLGLSACAPMDKAGAPPPMDAALSASLLEQPKFSAGDFYRFNQPDAVWRVAAIEDGDLLRWELEAGRGQLTYQHPFFPPLEWWSEGTGNGRRLITNVQGDLFPMAVGKRMTFKATVSADTPPHAWEYDWSCEVLRQEEVQIEIGRFATYVVQCGRVQPDEYMFWYAPTVGFYVRYRVTRFGQPPLTREMIGFRNAVLASRGESLAKLQIPGPEGMALEAPPITARVPDVASAEPERPENSGAPTALTPANRATPPQVTQAAPPPVPNNPPPAAPAQAAVKPAAKPQEVAAATPPARSSVPVRTQPKAVETPSAPAQTIADVPPAPAKPAAAAASADMAKAAGLHLASYKDKENAERGWRQLLSRNEDVLKGLSHTIEPIDLGERGTFFRLVAGPVTDRDMAEKMCGTLKTRGAYCQIVN